MTAELVLFRTSPTALRQPDHRSLAMDPRHVEILDPAAVAGPHQISVLAAGVNLDLDLTHGHVNVNKIDTPRLSQVLYLRCAPASK